jgi:hypothetical protein
MDKLIDILVCVVFIAIGVLLAVFAKNIVTWLYQKTMNFWSKRVNPERKKYVDQQFQKVWYWKIWWLWSLWTYRIIGIIIAVFFTVLLILIVTR